MSRIGRKRRHRDRFGGSLVNHCEPHPFRYSTTTRTVMLRGPTVNTCLAFPQPDPLKEQSLQQDEGIYRTNTDWSACQLWPLLYSRRTEDPRGRVG